MREGRTHGAEMCHCLDSTFGQEYTLSTHLSPHVSSSRLSEWLSSVLRDR